MTGGFSVEGVHTRDFGLCLNSKELTAPVKKASRVSIPFMHGTYDFSDIYGDVYFEDRELTYLFDVLGDSPADVESTVSAVSDWAAMITNADILDDDIPFWHYRGSCTEIGVERDESGLMAQLEIKMTIYPFKIADDPCRIRVEIGDNVVANRGHRAQMTVVPDQTMTIQIGSLKQTFSSETVADIALEHGDNVVTVSSGGGSIEWREEMI